MRPQKYKYRLVEAHTLVQVAMGHKQQGRAELQKRLHY